MPVFSKDIYIKKGLYENEYMVNPQSGVKRCRCCDKLFYSVEFINLPEMIDGKMPVCIKCYRSKVLAERADGIMQGLPEVRNCRKCEIDRPISEFRNYSKRTNAMNNICQECSPARPRWWEENENEDGD